MNRFPLISLIFSFILTFSFSAQAQNKLESIFSSGEVYKILIPETGIYKLTYEQLRDNTDIAVDAIDPKNIHIYGNEGGLLPLANNIARADDLTENRVIVRGENDGSFDSGDYILFYAEGANRTTVASNNSMTYQKNIYDLNNYYYIKIESNPGLRISERNKVTTSEYKTSSDRLIRHEIDKENLLGQFGSTQGSGKRWYGETFTNERQQDFSRNFTLSNPVPNQQAVVSMGFAARSPQASSVELEINGEKFIKTIGSVDLGEIEYEYAENVTLNETVTLSASPEVSVRYTASGNNSEAWLDYIQLLVEEEITVGSEPRTLFNLGSHLSATSGFSLAYNGSDLNVWDITSPTSVFSMPTESVGSSSQFGYNAEGDLKVFVAFKDESVFKTPVISGKVVAQNLHGIERADMVIVYYAPFVEAAEKLAQHRISQDGLVVELIEVSQIYNEFAGGKSDPIALRDMARMLHRRDDKFRYMILLGDATYDYRGLYPQIAYQNFVPTYQTDESLYPIDAFPTDDFFGLLSDDEGSDNLTGELDLGIGRIPAKDLDEAMAVVDKIIHYDTNDNRYGEWRNKIGFAADDVDKTWDTTHMRDADEIARDTEEAHPCMVQQKVYWDAYVQESTPGGARYPDANKAINDNIFKGQLVFNYLGHGGPKGLSQERVLQIPDIRSWNNIDKLPVFITATCSFTGFDEPNFVSAGEHLILNPNGGAVAIFTTVRSVFANQNKVLTQDIYKNLFKRTDGIPSRLGDIIIKAKNEGASAGRENTRKFLLIGDPSMRLALPTHKALITHFNNEEITSASLDTLGALGKASMGGQIVSQVDSSLISDFTGKIFITVYDKPSTLYTLVNDGKGSAMPFDVNKNILYRGTASVTNGNFELSFILPKDINFEYGKGSINLYATDDNSIDATGCYGQLVVGGSSSTAIDDNEGPEIEVFFNDRSFSFGGETTKEPLLIIDLADENGINLSSTSIGHDITATLEDKNGDKIVLNDFYTPTVDRVGEGTVSYQMGALEPGPHKLYIKAWDILNNFTEEVIEFNVVNCEVGFIKNVLNYPNPFSTNTDFTFEHDLINTNLDINVNIYTVSGKLVKSIVDNRFSSTGRINDINWNGRDDYGNKLAKGIYLYKIKVVASELNLSRESDFMKLVILH